MPPDGRRHATRVPCDSHPLSAGYLGGINALVVSRKCVHSQIIDVKAASYDCRDRARSRHYRVAGRDPCAKCRRRSCGFDNRRPKEITSLEPAISEPCRGVTGAAQSARQAKRRRLTSAEAPQASLGAAMLRRSAVRVAAERLHRQSGRGRPRRRPAARPSQICG